MTSTVNEVTIATLTSSSYIALTASLAIFALILLVIMLITKELARILDNPRSNAWMQALDIVILPLLLAFAVVIITRFLAL